MSAGAASRRRGGRVAGNACRIAIAFVALLAASAVSAANAGASAHPADPAGVAIYREGRLPDGTSLVGMRAGGAALDGRLAACATCHRRSGLGATEGRATIPPIAGDYLFAPATAANEHELQYVPGMHLDREPYTRETLARALRTGIGADGRPFNALMPRYALDDASMNVLLDYLQGLGRGRVPGTADDTLHFATVVTPDADPVKKRAMLAVLEQFFADKNFATRAVAPPSKGQRRMMWRVVRRWQLHVWELTGEPATWEAQLEQNLAREPVFAMISGLGGRTWAPVHRFCERQALPCLLPNVEEPVVDERDFYTVYYSKGVLLESGLIASSLAARDGAARPRRVVQVYRPGDVGEGAARDLAARLTAAGIDTGLQPIEAGAAGRQLGRVTAALAPDEALVAWLRPDDVTALGGNAPPRGGVWLSGLMGGLDAMPLAEAWRGTVHVAYPFDLPERRVVRVDYPLGWFRIRSVPVVAEQVQVDTWLACSLLSETLNHMVDTFVRDYLVERIETMAEHRILTGYYPRLALAPGQRFASKGGYVVRFDGARVVPEGEWFAP